MLAAPVPARARILGDARATEMFAVFREVMLHTLRQDAFEGPVLSSTEAVVGYLIAEMGFREVEEVRALFLNGANHLIREEVVNRGSISHAIVTPRQLVARALELNATALILVHNHPSGNPRPSRSDIQVTRAIDAAAKLFQIAFHDHLIITRFACVSLRQQGWPS